MTGYAELNVSRRQREPYLSFLRSQHSHHVRLARVSFTESEQTLQRGIARGIRYAALRYIEDERRQRRGGHL